MEAYELTRSRMREDLGIEPGPQTAALYLEILYPQPIPNGAELAATEHLVPAVARVMLKPPSAA